MTNHIVRKRCRRCVAWRPESVPEATREEFEQYENFMAKKQRKQKKKKRAAASEQRGVPPSKELPEEPDRKRRRRHWGSGLSDDSAGSVQRSPTAGERGREPVRPRRLLLTPRSEVGSR